MGILNIENWRYLSKGYYRYVVGANVCYEIQFIKHYFDKPISQAQANLYLVGDWHDQAMQINYFERELLCGEKSVKELLECAKEDFDKNMK